MNRGYRPTMGMFRRGWSTTPDARLLAGEKEKTLERLHDLDLNFDIHFFTIDELLLDPLLHLRGKLHDRVGLDVVVGPRAGCGDWR